MAKRKLDPLSVQFGNVDGLGGVQAVREVVGEIKLKVEPPLHEDGHKVGVRSKFKHASNTLLAQL